MTYTALITFFNSPNPNLAIQSVLAQSKKPHEIIVVDDCSAKDFQNDLERIAHENSCIYIRAPRNLGPAGARNLGIRIAATDIIMIFDDDDESLPNRAEIHLASIAKGNQLSYVSSRKFYPNGYSFDASNEDFSGLINFGDFSQLLLTGKRSEFFPQIFVPAATLAFQKVSMGAQLHFDESLRRLEDVDFALQAALKGLVFDFSSSIGVSRYSSEGNDKISLVESVAQLEILRKYKNTLGKREYKQTLKWYQIRSAYFSNSYIKLTYNTLTYFCLYGVDLRRVSNAVARIFHDIKKSRRK